MMNYFCLVKQKCRISLDATGAADTLILINYRFLPGISVTYGTRATGSHIQHQRDSVGRTADYTWLDFSPDFHPKPRRPSAQEYFPHRWKSREGFNFTFTRGSECFCRVDHTNCPRGDKAKHRAAACCVRNIKYLAKTGWIKTWFQKKKKKKVRKWGR